MNLLAYRINRSRLHAATSTHCLPLKSSSRFKVTHQPNQRMSSRTLSDYDRAQLFLVLQEDFRNAFSKFITTEVCLNLYGQKFIQPNTRISRALPLRWGEAVLHCLAGGAKRARNWRGRQRETVNYGKICWKVCHKVYISLLFIAFILFKWIKIFAYFVSDGNAKFGLSLSLSFFASSDTVFVFVPSFVRMVIRWKIKGQIPYKICLL